MRMFIMMATLVAAQSAMAIPATTDSLKQGLIANTVYQQLVEGIHDSGENVVLQRMNPTEMSTKLIQQCTDESRSGSIIAVHAVNSAGDVTNTNLFGTTERAKDLKQCK